MSKTLKLKYGEYYSLKITDSSKNIINNVEFISSKITSEQEVFTAKTYSKSSQSADEKKHIDELKKGVYGLQSQEEWNALSDDEKNAVEDEFYSWRYEKILESNRQSAFKEDVRIFEPIDKKYPHKDGKQVSKHDLKCEFQVLERELIKETIRTPIQSKTSQLHMNSIEDDYLTIGYKYKTETVPDKWKETCRWTEEFTTTDITKETLTEVSYNIKINQDHLRMKLGTNSSEREFYILNWRYKLTGGLIKIEKLDKVVSMDDKSYSMRGKHSYAYPEGTLLEANADVSVKDENDNDVKESLQKHISDHILSRYKDGRETFEMSWQGDPTMTLGDRIILEDKFGIEKEFMITGNEFVLENSGKFFMRTEGISVL